MLDRFQHWLGFVVEWFIVSSILSNTWKHSKNMLALWFCHDPQAKFRALYLNAVFAEPLKIKKES